MTNTVENREKSAQSTMENLKTAIRALDAKSARDVVIREVADITTLADFFVIATATSTTHLKTLSEETEFRLTQLGVEPHHVEGHASGNWILLDYHDILIHLFLEETRNFYDLERLWRDAKEIQMEELLK